MGLHDLTASAVPATPNRLDQVVAVLDEGKLIDELNAKHDVTLFRFDSDVTQISAFPKVTNEATSGDQTSSDKQSKDNARQPETAEIASPPTDWREAALPQGSETRLGQCLQRLIADERSSPVAGVVVFSDGGQNAGVDPSGAIAAAPRRRSPSSPSASVPTAGPRTSAWATWWRRPGLIRATVFRSQATCNPKAWPIAASRSS